jgi:hypothetical protein
MTPAAMTWFHVPGVCDVGTLELQLTRGRGRHFEMKGLKKGGERE